MNATMKKFGYPLTALKEFEKWVVLLRPQQVTLGALVLVCREPAGAFSRLSREAFAELHAITGQIEQGLKHAFGYDKINYLMLMMVDPDVHFHIIPRYAQAQNFSGRDFHDHGWPGPPELGRVNKTDTEINQSILSHLLNVWEA